MNNLLKAAAILSIALFFSCKGNQNSNSTTAADSTKQATDTTKTRTVYTCPMHPEVVSDTAGTCPKCGMALEPKS